MTEEIYQNKTRIYHKFKETMFIIQHFKLSEIQASKRPIQLSLFTLHEAISFSTTTKLCSWNQFPFSNSHLYIV